MKTAVPVQGEITLMNIHSDDTIVISRLDSFDQSRKITHLKEWLTMARERPSQDLMCRGLERFIHLDVLRYGYCGSRVGFAAVRLSVELRKFINQSILPENLTIGTMLDLLAEGTLLMETEYRDDHAEFVFYPAHDEECVNQSPPRVRCSKRNGLTTKSKART